MWAYLIVHCLFHFIVVYSLHQLKHKRNQGKKREREREEEREGEEGNVHRTCFSTEPSIPFVCVPVMHHKVNVIHICTITSSDHERSKETQSSLTLCRRSHYENLSKRVNTFQ